MAHGNIARRGDLRDGLRKSVVERGCPSLSASTVKVFRGGHSVGALTQLLKVDRFERDVHDRVVQLKQMLEADHKNPDKRLDFMNGLLVWKDLNDSEAEAVKRVYIKLYGKLPMEEISL